jgi:hypothetical protein
MSLSDEIDVRLQTRAGTWDISVLTAQRSPQKVRCLAVLHLDQSALIPPAKYGGHNHGQDQRCAVMHLDQSAMGCLMACSVMLEGAFHLN